ncbi:hypothetical protein K2Z83_22835 [Oscillochloris sp. ZM17-4]|uniref:hypothetical protein n=1 Tax=Oscillochloris sp. ZM17-4 TaxID=2866714 RepID=UPI001C739B29|nr:hypothetical protein [Oscillochloris sp. ZM17-4]MBX0330495.1 hypothetical protein [Oscillochloris sp. ZM17-4]
MPRPFIVALALLVLIAAGCATPPAPFNQPVTSIPLPIAEQAPMPPVQPGASSAQLTLGGSAQHTGADVGGADTMQVLLADAANDVAPSSATGRSFWPRPPCCTP